MQPRQGAHRTWRAAPAMLGLCVAGLCVAASLGVGSARAVENQPPAPGEVKWVAPALEKTRQNPLGAEPEHVRRGRRLFLQHCSICHGDNGGGDGPSARMHAKRSGYAPRDLTSAEVQEGLSDGEIFWKMTTGFRVEGKIVMPSYGEELLPDDRWRVVLFVRTLRRGPPGS